MRHPFFEKIQDYASVFRELCVYIIEGILIILKIKYNM